MSMLLHGPGAGLRAIAEAGRLGHLLAPPMGEKGLKVEEAREAVELLQSTPIASSMGVVVLGPMDRADPKSSDVLLKSLEEGNRYVTAILWAHDLDGVMPTLQSRLLPVYCPPTGAEVVDEALEEGARQLLHAAQTQPYQIPQLVMQFSGQLSELLAEMCSAMSDTAPQSAKVRALWTRIRPLTLLRNPSPMEVVAALLPVEPE